MSNPVRLTEQERLFCTYYSRSGDGVHSAEQAGFPAKRAAATAARLLARGPIQAELARCWERQRQELEALALAGLRRIAFGSVGDAVRLITEEDLSPTVAAGLDLFAVSEIRHPRGGGWEIKFHDRLRALTLLLDHGPDGGRADSLSLLEALDKSAAALTADRDEDGEPYEA